MRLNPFDTLEDLLLRGGIVPRHVKRYLRELGEHLADLTAAQAAAGFDADNAAAQARTALGPDTELADAMLKQRDFRSLSARFPWAVFAIAPPLLLLVAAFLQVILFITLMHLFGFVGPRGFVGTPAGTPGQLAAFMMTLQAFGNFLVVPAIALLFVVLALRQRLSLLWPLFSTLLIIGLSLHWDIGPWAPDPHGWGAMGISYRVTANNYRFGFTPMFLYAWWKALPAHGFTLATQYVLCLLPLAWLAWTRRKAAA